MNFVSLDVETANPDLSSICQIGLARFENGQLVEKWESLVDPEDEFDGMNVFVHGIDESTVAGSPTFPLIAETLGHKISDTIVVCHTTFDQSAIRLAFTKYGLEPLSLTWLDTARVVRRTWLDLSRRGYGLGPVAEKLGIRFQHHDAAEDARAAGEILIHAIHESGLSIEEWLVRSRQPINGKPDKLTRAGNSDGPFFGEVAVFTGALSMVRRDAADLAAKAGCDVADSVTKKTTLLIVGDQDIRLLAGNNKSSKHRKAELLIKQGQAIRILRESDFRNLTSFSE